jgi:hypothetical protein
VVYVADGSARVSKERIEGFCGSRTAILDDYLSLELFDERRHERRRLKSRDKGHREEIFEFINGVRIGRPAVELCQIANTSLITLATIESLRTGRAVSVGESVGMLE